jgi:hypothetical protein
LLTITPGGFEKFFEEANGLSTDGPPDMEKLTAAAEKYDVRLVQPSQGS